MADFKPFATAVHALFTNLSQHELFTTVDGDELYAAYLAAFPEGTNRIYKERTEHDCSCCRNFLRNIGPVVAIVDGKARSIWRLEGLETPYQEVADALADLVEAAPVQGLFRPTEHSYGAQNTKQLLEGSVIRWDHFHGSTSIRHRSLTPAKAIGDYNTQIGVFRRGLEELSLNALTEVKTLIKDDLLYRGAEFKSAVDNFTALKAEYIDCDNSRERELFLYSRFTTAGLFKNTLIGSLVDDISQGMDLQGAVASYEAKVAPTNYKRSKALITPGMIKTALATIAEQGLENTLARRYAKIDDIWVNDVLWVDNSARNKMKGGLEDLLMSAVPAPKIDTSKAAEIKIEDFMATVLPEAKGMEMLVEGKHFSNLVSLTGPVHADSGKLFNWGNDFGWSYSGEVTDSIKDRVKAAGGNVTNAKLRISLSWFNHDDLDLHVTEPNGKLIYYGNRGGKLDVDMHNGGPYSREPVENVSYTEVVDGVYSVRVNKYRQQENSDIGYQLQIESEGRLYNFSHPGAAMSTQINALFVTVKNGVVTDIKTGEGVTGGNVSQEVWGVKSETFAKVQTVMLSPNFWGGKSVGNKHHFFMLEGCANPEDTRGIYNEFLAPELTPHRKVFEVLAAKTKCPYTTEQLSGMGFSSTKRETVTVKVTTAKTQKVYNINF